MTEVNTYINAIFFSALAIVLYTYLGYGLIMLLLVKFKKVFFPLKERNEIHLEKVSLIVPCYNEGDFIVEKIKNTLALDYPADMIEFIFITDGTRDRSLDLIQQFSGDIIWMHEEERRGKASAMNRASRAARHPILIFCDANTLLNREAVKNLVTPYQNPEVGAVTGEKKIISKDNAGVSTLGEGIYWKYESLLKTLDSELYSVVGAAGELMSFRKNLYEPLEQDTILDDFMQSMRICLKGYKVKYTAKAFAMETASLNTSEEWKRKVRICAGGWQSMFRLWKVLLPFPNPVLTFCYISHRVLRWSLAPLALAVLLVVNLIPAIQGNIFFIFTMSVQLVFYSLAYIGYYLEKKGEKNKATSLPFYFTMMNLAVFYGLARFVKGTQKSTWERVQRA